MLKKNLTLLILSLMPISSFAFNGILLTGSGQVSSAMGGVSIGGGLDRASIADNPANTGLQSEGIDGQLVFAIVDSKAKYLGQNSEYKSNQFVPMPEFAIIKKMNDKVNLGLVALGSGASLNYDKPPVLGVPSSNAKINLANATISPTVSYSIHSNLSVGASFNLGIQQFRATGVFAGMNEDNPIILQSHGNKWAFGTGFSLGLDYQINSQTTIGASYISETRFSKLSGYKEDLLLTSDGQVNLPEKYGIGIIHKFNDQITFAADILHINWKDTDTAGQGKNGLFNWQNQNVYRTGIDYRYDPLNSIRIGYSYADKAVMDPDHTVVNFYANSASHQSITVGYAHIFNFATLNLAYEYSLENTVDGRGINIGTDLKNRNHVLTVGLSKKF